MPTFNGTTDDDTLSGGARPDAVYGLEGDDTLNGGRNRDSLYGGADDDVLYGGDDNDYLDGGAGDDSLDGGAGDDSFGLAEGNNTLVGGEGSDMLLHANGDESLTIDMTIAAAQQIGPGWITFVSVEGVWLGDGNDLVIGNDEANYINVNSGENTVFGGGGDDSIRAWGADDSLSGGDGNDALHGLGGRDTLSGDDGDDLISASAWSDDDHAVVDGGAGRDRLELSSSDDLEIDLGTRRVQRQESGATISISGIEDLTSGFDNDTLIGSRSANKLNGNSGDDTLSGGRGADTLDGDYDDDVLSGGDGADLLMDRYGLNTYTGGRGADIFQVGSDYYQTTRWTITDFDASVDRFDLYSARWFQSLTEADVNGDGRTDTRLVLDGDSDVITLGVAGLTLAEWNDLIV